MTIANPSVPSGLRVYAIGDIHGRLDLLKQLEEKIDAEARDAGVTTQKIFLGDYIDRGLQSRETIEYLMAKRGQEKTPSVFLRGNHESVISSVIENEDAVLLERWLSFGGRETLLSYGIKPSNIVMSKSSALVEDLKEKVPATHLAFFDELQLKAEFGDYFFCHAGVRPGVTLAKQNEEDLTWIRHEFLDCNESFGKMVVHGHSISLEAEFKPNRIGIDTGAYATGRLTALGLEGTRQWLIQTA